MSRARNIKPGFFKNDLLAECSPLARILFVGLWCEADREGRLEDRAKRIKAECLPYDDCDVSALLDELNVRGFIFRYEVNGSQYIAIPEFLKHQNPHCKEQASSIPAPEKHSASTVQAPVKHDESTEVARLIPDSLLLIPDSLQEIPTAVPAADPVKPSKRKSASGTELQTWIDSLPADQDAIAADDPIFAYATSIRLPAEYIHLAWAWFKVSMEGKRQKDWRKHFRNAVRNGWPKYWWPTDDGGWRLSPAGEQAKRAMEAQA